MVVKHENEMDFSHYEQFLTERRKLISMKIRDYYLNL